jgi:hypothetical protein
MCNKRKKLEHCSTEEYFTGGTGRERTAWYLQSRLTYGGRFGVAHLDMCSESRSSNIFDVTDRLSCLFCFS